MPYTPLSADDLIPDEPLDRMSPGAPISDELDSLNHRATAQRVAELALVSRGHLNIALFGPWGSGKSSFFGLLSDQLNSSAEDVVPIRFDAWKNSGTSFQTNFLSSIAADIPGADKEIAGRLFRTSTSVQLPFGLSRTNDAKGKRSIVVAGILILVGVFVGVPALWTWLTVALNPKLHYPTLLASNLTGWLGIAAGSTLAVVVISALLELSKVTIQESTPSHVSQFGALFSELMATDKNRRYVIFIDELDRCSPPDVIQTLEGLRTFLGHDRCVFIVAFDREAVAATIAQNLPNNVPARPRRPYYSTSGEYLDKIFQFQIALPPQPSHTFRRFAESLVRGRGGLWGELFAIDPKLLARVVRILTPMHVTSPRRTKVLLNDFVMNCRILERLDFHWSERSEEIAALTVLQTEFPTLAADLEEEPQLLRYVATGIRPNRAALMEKFDFYQEHGAAQLDEIVSDIEADDDEALLDESVPTHKANNELSGAEGVAHQLARNLHRFLRKLADMEVTLPRPDLILMHSDSNLLSFEDLNVYNALLKATDEPRSDTLALLALASEEDRKRALAYLLEQAELESGDDAVTLVILAGEVAGTLGDVALPAAADAMFGGWRQAIIDDRAVIASFTSTSLTGFARAFAGHLKPGELQQFLEFVGDQKPNDLGQVLGQSILAIPKPMLKDHAYLARLVATVSRTDNSAVDAFFSRMDDAGIAPLSDSAVSNFQKQLTVVEPELVAPSTPTAPAVAIAEQQNARAKERYEAQVLEAQAATAAMGASLASLPGGGAARASILKIFRAIGPSVPSAWQLHDQAIQALADSGQEDLANREILVAAATNSSHRAQDAWIPLLRDEHELDPDLLRGALDLQIRLASNPKNRLTFRLAAAENVAALGRKKHGIISTPEGLIRLSDIFFTEAWEPGDFEEQFRVVAAVVDGFESMNETALLAPDLEVKLVRKAVEAVGDLVDFDFLLEHIEKLPAPVAIATASGLEDLVVLGRSDLTAFRATLASQKVAVRANLPVEAISGEIVQEMIEAGLSEDDAFEWIRTGPGADEILESGIDLLSIPSRFWSAYSHQADEAKRQGAWRALHDVGADSEMLKAVASGGVAKAFYEERASEVEQAKTAAARGIAVGYFRSLPSGTKNAGAAAMTIAKSLISGGAGNKTEVPTVVTVLLENAKGMTASQRTSFATTLGPLVESVRDRISKKSLQSLRDYGFVPKEETLLEKIGRGLTGRPKK